MDNIVQIATSNDVAAGLAVLAFFIIITGCFTFVLGFLDYGNPIASLSGFAMILIGFITAVATIPFQTNTREQAKEQIQNLIDQDYAVYVDFIQVENIENLMENIHLSQYEVTYNSEKKILNFNTQ